MRTCYFRNAPWKKENRFSRVQYNYEKAIIYTEDEY